MQICVVNPVLKDHSREIRNLASVQQPFLVLSLLRLDFEINSLPTNNIENIMGKRENAGHQYFLLFPLCFQKLSLAGLFILGIVW